MQDSFQREAQRSDYVVMARQKALISRVRRQGASRESRDATGVAREILARAVGNDVEGVAEAKMRERRYEG